MATEIDLIYAVLEDKYAYSMSGEIGTRFVSPCVLFIIFFSDHTVMLEHRTDLDLFNNEELIPGPDLFELL